MLLFMQKTALMCDISQLAKIALSDDFYHGICKALVVKYPILVFDLNVQVSQLGFNLVLLLITKDASQGFSSLLLG